MGWKWLQASSRTHPESDAILSLLSKVRWETIISLIWVRIVIHIHESLIAMYCRHRYFFQLIWFVSVRPSLFGFYLCSGTIGSGVCVFSKLVIEDSFYHLFPLNGYFHKIQHGDWFGGKGLGMCRVSIQGISINIYCTHVSGLDGNHWYLHKKILDIQIETFNFNHMHMLILI